MKSTEINLTPIICCAILAFGLSVFGITSCCSEEQKTKAIKAKEASAIMIEGMKHGIRQFDVKFN